MKVFLRVEIEPTIVAFTNPHQTSSHHHHRFHRNSYTYVSLQIIYVVSISNPSGTLNFYTFSKKAIFFKSSIFFLRF